MQYGLIGAKLGHSFSKTIHELLCNYKYELKELPSEEEFNIFMQKREFSAINVTIPYKEKVIPYCAALSPLAQSVGAVNTIINNNGVLYGDNTDFYGFTILAQSVAELKNKNVMILGTGGTCKTALAVATKLGAAQIITVSRSGKNGSISYSEAALRKDTEILINTSPVGMYPDNFGVPPIDFAAMPNLSGVVDVVYNPLQTMLVAKAKSLDIPVANGLLMLVGQAKKSAELFRNTKIEDDKIQYIMSKILSQTSNIILVGMPSCGKTSIGRELAMLTGRHFIDTDDLCEDICGQKISDIFAQKGEKAFRDIETEAVKAACSKSGQIIATGGGSILNHENTLAMHQNGVVFYITRDNAKLEIGGARPLSTSIDALAQMQKIREPIYKAICDIEIKSASKPYKTAALIKEQFDEFINNKRA